MAPLAVLMLGISNELDIFGELNAPEQSGWKREEDGKYVFDWDSPELWEQVQDTIGFLTKGCSCKHGCSDVGIVRKDASVGLGVTVMVVLTFLGIQTTRTQLTSLKTKVRRQTRRTRTHNAQVALRMKMRTA